MNVKQTALEHVGSAILLAIITVFLGAMFYDLREVRKEMAELRLMMGKEITLNEKYGPLEARRDLEPILRTQSLIEYQMEVHERQIGRLENYHGPPNLTKEHPDTVNPTYR